MDCQIRAFEDEIIGVINDSNLPMEVKRLALAEILHKVEAESNKIIRQAKESEVKDNGKTV